MRKSPTRYQISERQSRSSGQSMVEFALAIPFLLMILVGVMYFGRAFYMTQVLTYAAQEGARAATRVPNLRDPAVRESIRGFTTGGAEANVNSVIYCALGGGKLLSQGDRGDLPAGARVKILPWDADGSPRDVTPPGTVSVLIEYPYSLLVNPFTNQPASQTTSVAIALESQDPNPVTFNDFQLSEKATVTQEVYQEVN
jgi:hypothetical protein